MYTAIETPTTNTNTDTTHDVVGTSAPNGNASAQSARLAGFAALTFVADVILQNVVRGVSAPTNDAPASDVLTHFADHRGLSFLLIGMFVISGVSLATFLGRSMQVLTSSSRAGSARTGYLGATGILLVFGVLVACEQALSVVAHGEHPDPAAMSALWALHNSVFTVLLLFIGIALFGLARAGVAAGVTPRVFEWLAPVGSVMLAVSCAAGPGIAAGELGGVFAFGLIGFIIWLAFLTTTGIRLVRNAGARS